MAEEDTSAAAAATEDTESDEQQSTEKQTSNRDQSATDDVAAMKAQIEKLNADLDKWRTQARKQEGRAKENAEAAKAKQSVEEQLQQLRHDMADRDAEAVAEKADIAGERLHSKLVRGGMTDDDATALLNTIDPVRLLNDGKPDQGEIDKLAKTLIKIGTRPQADPDQGRKGGDSPLSMNQIIRQAAKRTEV